MSFLLEELFPANMAEAEGEEEVENLGLMETSHPHTYTSALKFVSNGLQRKRGHNDS